MSQIILRSEAIESSKARSHWFLIIVGMLAIIFPIMCMKTDAPDSVQRLTPFIAFVGIVLVFAGIWVYFSVRGEIFVTTGQGGQYGITLVNSKKKKVVELFSPFSLKCYSDLQRDGRFRFYFLYMIVLDNSDKPVLQFDARWPAIMGQPEGWKSLQAGDLDGINVPRYTTNSLLDLRKLLVKTTR